MIGTIAFLFVFTGLIAAYCYNCFLFAKEGNKFMAIFLLITMLTTIVVIIYKIATLWV